MCSEKDFNNCVNKIRGLSKVTDLLLVYNIDRKLFVINDDKSDRMIKQYDFNLDDFKRFLSEFSKIKFWKTEYEMNFQLIKN